MFSEFDHEEHVLKVAFGDRSELVAAIIRLHGDVNLRKKLSDNCTKYIKKHSAETTAREYEALYTELAER